MDESDPRQPALATLLAGIFACGGIATNWVPAWLPETERGHALIADALADMTDGYVTRHEDDPDRPTEFLPAEGATVFGRVLVAYGAPQGDKNDDSVGHLPQWLLEAPKESRLRAVELFLLERGTFFESKDTVTIQARNRRQSYRSDLATLVGSVTNEPVTAGRNVVVSAEAVRDLGFGRRDTVRR
ncbi:hypothetical protein [Halorarum salinum]|uniref:Uncharacterized protein n=1 Tax=Halorarum salinum TaxID=2743089 RepID=A0A7D5Q9N3_9EURY|nr:hypothetical protein [Halobaculum salinum]QLG61098.1 hypothetical protein HUG12_04850 [Halobaculum salinum]